MPLADCPIGVRLGCSDGKACLTGQIRCRGRIFPMLTMTDGHSRDEHSSNQLSPVTCKGTGTGKFFQDALPASRVYSPAILYPYTIPTTDWSLLSKFHRHSVWKLSLYREGLAMVHDRTAVLICNCAVRDRAFDTQFIKPRH